MLRGVAVPACSSAGSALHFSHHRRILDAATVETMLLELSQASEADAAEATAAEVAAESFGGSPPLYAAGEDDVLGRLPLCPQLINSLSPWGL